MLGEIIKAIVFGAIWALFVAVAVDDHRVIAYAPLVALVFFGVEQARLRLLR